MSTKVVNPIVELAKNMSDVLKIDPPLDTEAKDLQAQVEGLIPEIKATDDLTKESFETLKKLGWNAKEKKVSVPKTETPKEKKEVAKAKKPVAKSVKAQKEDKADLRKITRLVKENPKRAGSESAKRFNNYKTGMTVQKALDAGITRGDVAWDIEHKFISVK